MKEYGFFAIIKNIDKNLSGKYSWKLYHTNKSATDTLKTTSKRIIEKRAEAILDLIDNKIANNIAKNASQNNSGTSS